MGSGRVLLFPAPKAGLHCDWIGDPWASTPSLAFPSSKSWAPLRLLERQLLQVTCAALFPAPKAGLHCDMTRSGKSYSGSIFSQLQKLGSIATSSMSSSRYTRGDLFPAPKAGLHCDELQTYEPTAIAGPFPSSKSWAPLRQSVDVLVRTRRDSFPSSKSWAPLRRGSLARGDPRDQLPAFPSSKSWAPLRRRALRASTLQGRTLFPAPKAGLHCDSGAHTHQLSGWAFSQLQKLGSIATYSGGASTTRNHHLFPAPKAGLHCDHKVPNRSIEILSYFSQLQKLGSIATGPLPVSFLHGGKLFPAPKAGLHCDLYRRKAINPTINFSQLQKLGSIATTSWTQRSRLPEPAFPSSKSWAPLRQDS